MRQTEYTPSEAAALLGIDPETVRHQIARGRMQARRIGKRLHVVTGAEIERYRCEHIGANGWDKRKSPGYVASPKAAYMRQYRNRCKQAQQDA